jgi:hypothetical protein
MIFFPDPIDFVDVAFMSGIAARTLLPGFQKALTPTVTEVGIDPLPVADGGGVPTLLPIHPLKDDAIFSSVKHVFRIFLLISLTTDLELLLLLV